MTPRPARSAVPDWAILVIACVAQFMVILDVSIVNVALPSIGRELHYSPTGLQWVVNAYVLVFAGFLLLGGRAADLYGRRKVYLFGIALFAAASLVGGFAQSSSWLTVARAFQGLGGAVLSPATLTILVTSFSGPRLVRALGLWSAIAGAGAAAGVTLGGILTSELSWRWVLFVNVPIAALAMVFALSFLTELRRTDEHRRLDVAGALTATGGLALLVYAIVDTDVHPWTAPTTIVLLLCAAAVLAVFVLIERRTAAPLVPFRLFRSRFVSGANVVMFLVGGAFFSMWYFLSLFVQNVLGYSALRTGFAFLPMAVTMIVGSQVSSRLTVRLGQRPLMFAGTLCAAAGYLWLSRIHAGADYLTAVALPAVLVSLGIALLFTPLASAATTDVAQSEAGLASGVLNTSRQVGGSLGLAVLATIATDRTQVVLHHSHRALAEALAAGYSRAFVIAAGLCVAGFVLAAMVPGRRRARRAEPVPAEDQHALLLSVPEG